MAAPRRRCARRAPRHEARSRLGRARRRRRQPSRAMDSARPERPRTPRRSRAACRPSAHRRPGSPSSRPQSSGARSGQAQPEQCHLDRLAGAPACRRSPRLRQRRRRPLAEPDPRAWVRRPEHVPPGEGAKAEVGQLEGERDREPAGVERGEPVDRGLEGVEKRAHLSAAASSRLSVIKPSTPSAASSRPRWTVFTGQLMSTAASCRSWVAVDASTSRS